MKKTDFIVTECNFHLMIHVFLFGLSKTRIKFLIFRPLLNKEK